MGKRRDFSLEEKKKLLKDYDALPKMSQEAAAAKLNVSQPFLNQLLKKRDQVETAILHNVDPHRKRIRHGKDPAVEKALKNWFSVMREKDARVGGEILKTKAEQLAKLMGKGNFKATNGWFTRWKKRENLVDKKLQREQLKTDHVAAEQITVQAHPPPPDGLTLEQFNEWVAVDENVLTSYHPTDEESTGIGFDSTTLEYKESDQESDDDVDDSPAVPSSHDVSTALETLRRYVQHNGFEFEMQYQYENFVNKLMTSKKRQEKITELTNNL